jgi:hypothetical protein
MPEERWKTSYLFFLVFVSFSTLFLLVAITILAPRVADGFAWRRQLTGSAFSLLCILGMIAVFFPQHCAPHRQEESLFSEGSYLSSHREPSLQKSSFVGDLTVTHGHHPSCDRYRQHELVFGNKTLCSACLGLFCGALISLAGAWYAFLLQGPNGPPDTIVFALGIVGIAFGLASYVVTNVLGPLRRFLFNALMIFGMFLALVAVDDRVQSIALNALFIGFFIFVLFTKISLSQDRHDRICAACEQTCAT